jgi:hypothetical protein
MAKIVRELDRYHGLARPGLADAPLAGGRKENPL